MTIQSRIDAAAAGSTITIAPGVYDERITIDKPLTLAAEGVTLRTSGGGHVVTISGDDVTVDGLTVEHTAIRGGRDNLIEIRGDNATVRNCKLFCSAVTDRATAHQCHNAGDRRAGVRFSYGSGSRVEDTEIFGTFFGVHIPDGGGHKATITGCNIHHTVGSCIVIQPRPTPRGLLIDGCNLSYSYIEDGIQWQGAQRDAPQTFGTYVRNCTLIGNSENALDFKGAADVVVDGCVITQTIGSNDGALSGWNNHSAMAVMTGTGDVCENVIMRNCVLYNNCAGILHAATNARTYNSVIIYNNYAPYDGTGTDNAVASGERRVPGVGIRNCVIGGHRMAQIVSTLNDRDFDYNLYFAGGGSDIVGMPGNHKGAYPHHADKSQAMKWPQWRARLDAEAGVTGKDAHSSYYDEHLALLFNSVPVNPQRLPEEYDFRSTSELSPAWQAGGPLTTAIRASVGNVITVADAHWFSDGVGATQGDTITVGGQTVRITAIDRSGGAVTVDRAINVNAGGGVYFGASSTPNVGLLVESTVPEPPDKPDEPDEPGEDVAALLDEIRALLDRVEMAVA